MRMALGLYISRDAEKTASEEGKNQRGKAMTAAKNFWKNRSKKDDTGHS